MPLNRMRWGILPAILLLLIMAIQIIHSQPANATELHCFEKPDVLIVGLRGSGESQNEGAPGFEGFGPTLTVLAEQVHERINDASLVVAADALVYPADGAYDWGWDVLTPGVPYVDSHRAGVENLSDLLQKYDDCAFTGGPPRFILLGFSQGAHVIRTTLGESDHSAGSSLDAKISAIGLVADPRFRGDDDPGVNFGSWVFASGLPFMQGVEVFPQRYEEELHQLCDAGDLVCDGYGVSFHADYSEQELHALADKLADKTLIDMGYPALYEGAIVKWEGDSVTSWYVGNDGYRHWIEDASVWDCLIDNGANVHVLDETDLNRIPDAWGDHASCSSGSSGGSSGGGGSPGVGGFYLPYPNGVSHTVTQGPGDGSHECPGNSCEAIDFAMSLNDPILASESGTVRQFSTNANHSSGMGRFAMLEHANGLCTVYGHLNSLSSAITDGDGAITRGQTIGFAGDTGYSFGVHLHFALLNCSTWQSTNVDFVEVANPQAWSSYASQNSVPDSDGDGIVDPDDECPDEFGTLSNGCPLAPGAGRDSADSAINNADDVVHIFATASDGNPYVVWRNTNNWASSWALPGGMAGPTGVDLIGTPVSIQNSWDTTQTFAAGDDGNVYFIWRNSSGAWTSNGWVLPGGKASPSGINFTGEIAASLDNQGTLWVFATADNGNVYSLRRDSNGWSNWHLPGGNTRPGGVDLVGTPTAILNSDGVMHVFARGNDGNVYFLWRNGGGSWTSNGWVLPADEAAPSGVDFVEGPVSVVNSWGTTQTFVIGDDGNVYFIWRNASGVWTTNEWRLPGGNVAPDGVNFVDGLTAVMNHDTVVHVFATGDDGNIYVLWRNPNGWAPEWSFPGGFAAPSGVDFVGKPVSVQTSWDATLTFVFGDDGNAYKLFRSWDGIWGSTGWVKPNGINAPGGVILHHWAS